MGVLEVGGGRGVMGPMGEGEDMREGRAGALGRKVERADVVYFVEGVRCRVGKGRARMLEECVECS